MWLSRIHTHFFGDHSLRYTAEFLTLHALQLPSNVPYPNRKLSASEAQKIFNLFEERISNRLPVEYITNEAIYLNHRFYVNQHVLIPRSLMNTRFSEFLKEMNWSNHRVLDLCTGSGCIGISLALMHPKLQVDLADISVDALKVAAMNIEKHHLQDRVKCIQSNLFENIQGKYDLIITNPPYVSQSDYKKAPQEFKREPQLALVAGKDGLDIIHQILSSAKNHLNPNGQLIAEVGIASAKLIKKKYHSIAFRWLKYRKPCGKIGLLTAPSIFICKAKDLK